MTEAWNICSVCGEVHDHRTKKEKRKATIREKRAKDLVEAVFISLEHNKAFIALDRFERHHLTAEEIEGLKEDLRNRFLEILP